jgi:hypothetical protein
MKSHTRKLGDPGSVDRTNSQFEMVNIENENRWLSWDSLTVSLKRSLLMMIFDAFLQGVVTMARFFGSDDGTPSSVVAWFSG